MLTLLAYGMVVVFMTLIMTKRMAPLTALILVPLAFGLLAGYTGELGAMMLDGVTKLAPTGIMLTFAILFFAIMIDAGLFEPFVQLIVRRVHGDPMKVVVGTALLALLVSLDGDGSTTYMITTAAMLPLYRKLGIRPLILACVTMMAGGVMNVIPWGGPTARAASALSIDSSEIFRPMIPAMLVCSLWVLYAAYRLGVQERVRAGGRPRIPHAVAFDETPADPRSPHRRRPAPSGAIHHQRGAHGELDGGARRRPHAPPDPLHDRLCRGDHDQPPLSR